MPAAVIGAAGSIGSALIGSSASKKAAGIQANAMSNAAAADLALRREALQLQRDMYERGQEGLTPFREVGTSAMYSLADLYGLPTPANDNRAASEGGAGPARAGLEAFRASPEYQIPFNEGVRAIEYSRAAKGGLQNPNTSRELMQWGQGFAGSRLDGYIGRLLQIAGIGGNAAATGATVGTAQGTAMANTLSAGAQNQFNAIAGAGQANASGVVGQANAWNSAIGGVTNNLATYSLLNPTQSTYGGWNMGSGPGWMPPPANQNYSAAPGWAQSAMVPYQLPMASGWS